MGRWGIAHEAVHAVATSDGCSAAVTSEGTLYTWGSGLAGQLGHGHTFPVTYPKVVASLFDSQQRVMQVRMQGRISWRSEFV